MFCVLRMWLSLPENRVAALGSGVAATRSCVVEEKEDEGVMEWLSSDLPSFERGLGFVEGGLKPPVLVGGVACG